jgi:hypothetical protein
MDQQKTTDDIARRARLLGKSIGTLCKLAGVSPSTFSRWRSVEKPTSANFATMAKLTDELDKLEAQNGQ